MALLSFRQRQRRAHQDATAPEKLESKVRRDSGRGGRCKGAALIEDSSPATEPGHFPEALHALLWQGPSQPRSAPGRAGSRRAARRFGPTTRFLATAPRPTAAPAALEVGIRGKDVPQGLRLSPRAAAEGRPHFATRDRRPVCPAAKRRGGQ